MHVELQSEQLDFLSDLAIYIQLFNALGSKEHFLAWCRKEYLFTQHMLSISSKPNMTLGPGDTAETKTRSISSGKVSVPGLGGPPFPENESFRCHGHVWKLRLNVWSGERKSSAPASFLRKETRRLAEQSTKYQRESGGRERRERHKARGEGRVPPSPRFLTRRL